MFSDSRAPASGEQKGFKPHAPQFIPWLRNSLKSHHGSDLGLSRLHKSNSEARNNLTPLERPKGIGFFSFQAKDHGKKGDFRCNGMAMARMLPVVLRGPHILPGSLGKQREDSPVRLNPSPELIPEPHAQINPGDGTQSLTNSNSAQDNHTFGRNDSSHLSHSHNDRTSTAVRKYGPLVGPPPVPAPALVTEEPNCNGPVVGCMEDRRGKAWDYASHTMYHQRDLHSSSWVSPDTQGIIERQQEFSSSFRYIKQQSRTSQSLTALREPPVEGFHGAINRVIFSTEVPNRDPGCTKTLGHPRKPRPSSAHLAILGQNQTLFQHKPNSEGESQKKEAGCSRKAVHNQIKRVMDNLERVLTALRDVHQEMKEVVEQIDYLTSSIVLNEEEEQQEIRGGDGAKPPSDSSSISGSSSSEVRLDSDHQRPSQSERQPGTTDSSAAPRRDHHNRSQSPPSVQLCPLPSGASSERRPSLRFTCSVGCSPRKDGLLPYNHNLPVSGPPQLQNVTPRDLTLPTQRSLPIRPPTPGLSPLTVNLHSPKSPVSWPHSPGPSSSVRVSPVSPPSTLSPKSHPPPVLSPSVIIETQGGSYQTSQSDHLSAGLLSTPSTQAPSASCPPTDSEIQTVSNADKERRASSAGPVPADSQVCTASAATAKPRAARGRKGRKPPPYPHHRLSNEQTKKAKETRKTPPYPEKRRLLSTTV